MWKLPCNSPLPEQAQCCLLPWRRWETPGPRCRSASPCSAAAPRPAGPMLLLGLLLLTSALAGRRHGAAAESDLSSKFSFPGAKEQNGNDGAAAEPPAQRGRWGAREEPGPCVGEGCAGRAGRGLIPRRKRELLPTFMCTWSVWRTLRRESPWAGAVRGWRKAPFIQRGRLRGV